MSARTPADDAGDVAARPWFVQIESCRINGEDDVMSPEPPEIVWADSADDAHDIAVHHRDYDTNLLTARPATGDEARAEVDRLRATLAAVDKFVSDAEQADSAMPYDAPSELDRLWIKGLRAILSAANPASLADDGGAS